MVLLPGATADIAAEVAARLRFALIAPIRIDGRFVQIDASIGATTAVASTLDALLRAADAEMYREKATRRHPAVQVV